MKKLLTFIAITGLFMLGTQTLVKAQDNAAEGVEATAVVENDTVDVAEAVVAPAAAAEEEISMHQQIKIKFIEGGPGFMASILIVFIFGLAVAIERILYLNLATTNTDKLLSKIEEALEKGGVEAAKEVCRSTRGPVASIFYQGLDRASEGIDVVEKSVVAYGSVQTGQLESGLTWIALFIGIAPMLGFLGTVIGMIEAFDAIQAAGDISPSLVAGGIKVALITTVFGLIVAIILQIFYNYSVSKIDKLVNTMEDASISLIDILLKHNLKNN